MEMKPGPNNGFFLTRRQRYDAQKAQLDQDWYTFRHQYQDLNDFFLPSRGRFVISMDSNRGDRRNHKIIDNTGYRAARTLGSGMQAGITSPAREWKRLSTPDPGLAEVGPVRQWLDVTNQRMSTLFLRSNLYNVLPITYSDTGVFGTSAILMEKDEKTIATFESIPLGTYRIAKNRRGQVNVFYREMRMTVRQLIDHFGKNDELTGKPNWGVFSPYVRNLYERGQYEQWVEISHFIEPNPNYNPHKLEAKYKMFSSVYYERTTREHSGYEDLYLRDSGYDYFPVLVPRWQVTGADVYGTDCPGMASIGDVKELQHSRKMRAKAIAKMVDPPMKASASLKQARASLVSGDITYLDDMNDKFEPAHEVRIDLSHLTENLTDLRDSIKETFFTDVFLPILSDPRSDRTATEVNEIKEERLLALGPVLEQLNQDVLDPLIDNMYFLMNDAGLIPPPPKEIHGVPLKVEYISIMAQAQKLIGITSLDRLLQMANTVRGIDPSAIQKIDFHEYVEEYSDALGVSPRIILSDDKVQEIQQAQAKAQQAAQVPDQIQQVADAAQKLSQTDMGNKDSALSRLLEQANAGSLVQT